MELDESDPKVIYIYNIFRYYLLNVQLYNYVHFIFQKLIHHQIIIVQFIKLVQEEVFYLQQDIQLILLCL